VKSGEVMEPKKSDPEQSPSTHRLTISIPTETHDSVIQLAQKKRVSAAWIIREALEEYLHQDIPLFTNIRRPQP
jgi:hypothetical protein